MDDKKEIPLKNIIYEKLESNNLIHYEKKSSNKLMDKIILNDTETNCFKVIKDILIKNKCKTICRVAGGWVRDKLLGIESDDIDIALNDMKGSKLASLINSELYPEKEKVGIIKQNEEKGKHLETATIKINDIWVDFSNLRSEKEEEIGTPLEDAQRRDLSMNSLFYNINEDKIEDWTKKGINDLKNGVIDTPIESEIIFKDDPLRILRMLRFALKYKFRISDNINNCIEKNIEEYKKNYSNTISGERIEKELYKILKMENSSFAIAFLHKFNLLENVLQANKYTINNKKNTFNKIVNIFIIGQYLYNNKDTYNIFDINMDEDNFDKIDYGLLLLTLCFRNIKEKTDKENNTINYLILRDTLKTSNNIIKENQIMNQKFDELLSIINADGYNRLTVGNILKEITYKNIIKLLYGCLSYEYVSIICPESLIDSINEDELKPLIEKYKKFFDFIKNENLLHADEIKPLFNGKEIMELFNIKPSKEVGLLINYLVETQIEEPNLKKDEAVNLLTRKRKEFADEKAAYSKSKKDNNKNKKKKKK